MYLVSVMRKPFLAVENSECFDFSHAELTDFLSLWRGKRVGCRLPSRRDFDPLSMPWQLLRHIVLIDVLRQAKVRFRYRLIGTHITQALDRDSTGKFIDELHGANYDRFVEGFSWVVANGRPLRSDGNAIFVNKEWVRYESLILPLAADGVTVDMLLVPAVFTATDESYLVAQAGD